MSPYAKSNNPDCDHRIYDAQKNTNMKDHCDLYFPLKKYPRITGFSESFYTHSYIILFNKMMRNKT